jgi:hypothetical protein
MALFVPVISGEDHAGRAITAGRAILDAVAREGLANKGLMVGAGVHSRSCLRPLEGWSGGEPTRRGAAPRRISVRPMRLPDGPAA